MNSVATAAGLDLAGEIKERVDMEEAVALYTDAQPRHGRIPCPIHDGHDYNLAFKRDWWHCYVCGAGGDVISFTEQVCGLDFMGACERLNSDFSLGLPIRREASQQERRDLLEKRAERRRKRLQEKAMQEDYQRRYNALWDAWCDCDRTLRDFPPYGEAWAEAAKRIDYIGYLIDTTL